LVKNIDSIRRMYDGDFYQEFSKMRTQDYSSSNLNLYKGNLTLFFS
jgi:hypothetical protein